MMDFGCKLVTIYILHTLTRIWIRKYKIIMIQRNYNKQKHIKSEINIKQKQNKKDLNYISTVQKTKQQPTLHTHFLQTPSLIKQILLSVSQVVK